MLVIYIYLEIYISKYSACYSVFCYVIMYILVCSGSGSAVLPLPQDCQPHNVGKYSNKLPTPFWFHKSLLLHTNWVVISKMGSCKKQFFWDSLLLLLLKHRIAEK